MEINIIEKKIMKNYIKAKDNINDSSKLFKYVLKTLQLINESEKEKYQYLDISYLEKINNFCLEKLEKVFDNALKFSKKNKIDAEINHNIFNIINEGNINSFSETDNNCNFKIYNKEGLTPLHRCITLGDTTILKEILKRGENIDMVNQKGNTLLEFACLQNDPNLISFILNHGGDMKKHLYFRDNFKLKLNINDIDSAIIIKECILESTKKIKKTKFPIEFLLEYIDADLEIGISDIKFFQFLEILRYSLGNLKEESQETIINIWKEELEYDLNNKLGCPSNYFEIILMNLVPFIDFPFNISNRNVLTLELLNSIKNLLKKNKYQLDENFNIKLIDYIWEEYQNIIQVDYLGIILNTILTKIKSKLKVSFN